MIRVPLALWGLLLLGWASFAQETYTTSRGMVHFNASTPLEDIDASNDKVNAILKSGEEVFGAVMLIREFQFRRRLMQEHFNENYMESATYPKATFEGRIPGLSELREGETRELPVSGSLTIHGVTRPLETHAKVTRTPAGFEVSSAFMIRPEDHKVEVPKLLFNKIAEEVEVEVVLRLVNAK